jgi:OmpA-OmpF porin, OOP family
LKNLILVLFLISSLSLKAQNLISNPDFSDVDIYYNDGKQVNPKDWKYINNPLFIHTAKNERENFRLKDYQKTQGIMRIDLWGNSNVCRCGNGIIAKLKNRLEEGKSYEIKIELKIERITLNSDFFSKSYSIDGKPLDSLDYDYNYPTSLITYFSEVEPGIERGKRDFVLFDLPDYANSDKPEWLELNKTYRANGTEKYFSLGTFSPLDYSEMLKTIKKDTIDYYHKFSIYLIRNVSIFPINDSIVPINGNGDNTLTTIADHFDPNSIQQVSPNHKFIVRRVNFELSSFEISDTTKQEINKIALFMKKNSKFNLNITGHTDSIGTNQYNQILSEMRAEAVCQYLVSLGIEKGRLTCEGKGEEQPLAEKLLKKNFGLNRRVEFEFK